MPTRPLEANRNEGQMPVVHQNVTYQNITIQQVTMVQNKPNPQAEALNASRNYVERVRNQYQNQNDSDIYNNSNIVGQSQNQVSSYRRKRRVKR